MTQWSIWGGFMEKTRGQKSRATVPLIQEIRKSIMNVEFIRKIKFWCEIPTFLVSQYIFCFTYISNFV